MMRLIVVDGGPRRRKMILKRISCDFPETVLFSKEMEKKVIQ